MALVAPSIDGVKNTKQPVSARQASVVGQKNTVSNNNFMSYEVHMLTVALHGEYNIILRGY